MSCKETLEILDYAKKTMRYDRGCLFHTVSRSTVKAGQRAGCLRADGYRDVKIKGVKFLEHRVIWAICTGSWPENELDHIDRNSYNNAIENLRPADRYLNTANTGKRITNNSGYKNVYWNPLNSRWRVAVRVQGKRHNLGSFTSLNDAILARDNFIGAA